MIDISKSFLKKGRPADELGAKSGNGGANAPLSMGTALVLADHRGLRA